jgi:hypothetical protein
MYLTIDYIVKKQELDPKVAAAVVQEQKILFQIQNGSIPTDKVKDFVETVRTHMIPMGTFQDDNEDDGHFVRLSRICRDRLGLPPAEVSYFACKASTRYVGSGLRIVGERNDYNIKIHQDDVDEFVHRVKKILNMRDWRRA